MLLPAWAGVDTTRRSSYMATTVAAYGKVKAMARKGETMPEGWMVDRQGRPLLDPTRAGEGFPLPISGYKGYGLALIVGLLAGTLNGAANGGVRSSTSTRARPRRPTPQRIAILGGNAAKLLRRA